MPTPPIITNPLVQRVATRAFALACAELAANTRCEGVVVLDLRGRSPVTEFFVIATGTSPRQMRTIADEVGDLGKRMGYSPWKTEGYDSARWIVMDCVNVVVHVLDAESRDFYDLELLWGEESARVDWRRELGLPEPAALPPTSEPAKSRRFLSTEDEDETDLREVESPGGDPDLDEDAESDAPVMTEVAEEEREGIEFVEIDPPNARQRRGKTVFPAHVEEEDELESAMHKVEQSTVDEEAIAALESISAPAAKRPAKKKPAAKKRAKTPAKKSAKKPVKKPAAKKPIAKKRPVAKKPAAKKSKASRKAPAKKAAKPRKKSPSKRK